MTIEPRAKRRHPPPSALCSFSEGSLKHEQNARTAHVTILSQHGCTPTQVMFCQTKTTTHRAEDLASAGVHDPGGNLFAIQSALLKAVRKHDLGVFGSESGNLLG